MDGTITSVIIGLTGGAALILSGRMVFPIWYFGTAMLPDWRRSGFHMFWWTLAVLLGYAIGRGVKTIIADLDASFRLVEESQEREHAASQASDRLKQAAAVERITTLNEIATGFDQHVQGQ